MLELREYQREAVEAVESEWNAGRKNTLLVMATGLGKTICFASVAENAVRLGGNVLILAHRGELLDQAADKIERVTGLSCAREQSSSHSMGSIFPITVGSVQTMMRRSRLDEFPHGYFSHVIVDEAHHSVASSYTKVLDHFPRARVLGVTATADRADKKGLSEVFDSIAYEYGMSDGIRNGFLCPIEAQMIPIDIDISKVRVSKGDFDAGQLGNALEPYLDAIADEMATTCADRRTVVFMPLVRMAKDFAGLLNSKGLSACEVDGNSTDRDEVLRDFADGRYRVCVNSMLLTEGWDCPSVDCIVVLRPTKSRGLYCLDEETEVLTRDGWKADVEVGEEVLAFDKDTGETRFVPALAKVRRKLEPDEYFCSIKGQSCDIRVTNHHRMVYDCEGRTGWKFKEAQDLAQLRDGAYLPASGKGKFPGIPLTDGEIRFIGWVIADGSINPANNQIAITQDEQHAEHCEEIERCIIECGFKYNRIVRKRTAEEAQCNARGNLVLWTISKGGSRGTDRHLAGWARLEPWLSKDLSPRLFDMTESQFAVMLEAIYHGDGNKHCKSSYHIGKGNRTFIERLQAMAIQRGYRAGVSVERAGEARKSDIWHLHIKKQDFVKVGSQSGRHGVWTLEEHSDETCWCVQNELGTLVIRRNGKVAIVGNCQMVGRGTRLSPETGKEKLLLLDFLWLTERHNLCRPASLLAPNEDIERRMGERIAKGGVIDLLEAEGDAEGDALAERESSLAERLAENRKRNRKLVDPLEYMLSIQDFDLSSYEPQFAWERMEPTERQLAFLRSSGMDVDCMPMGRGLASKMIDAIVRRRNEGMATPKQVRMLEQKGFSHSGTWTFEQASNMMGILSKNRWQVPRWIDAATYRP